MNENSINLPKITISGNYSFKFTQPILINILNNSHIVTETIQLMYNPTLQPTSEMCIAVDALDFFKNYV